MQPKPKGVALLPRTVSLPSVRVLFSALSLIALLSLPLTSGAQTLPAASQLLEESGVLKVGEALPWFAAWRFDGRVLNRDQLLAEDRAGYLIIFSSEYCDRCRDGLKLIAAAQNELSERGIRVLLAYVGESDERRLQRWRRRLGITGITGFIDRFEVISTQFGIVDPPDPESPDEPKSYQLPRSLVIDRGGRLVKLIGFEGYDYIAQVTRAIRYAAIEVEEVDESEATTEEASRVPSPTSPGAPAEPASPAR